MGIRLPITSYGGNIQLHFTQQQQEPTSYNCISTIHLRTVTKQEEEPGEKHFKENHLMILMEYQSSKQSIWKFITKEGENYTVISAPYSKLYHIVC